MVEASRLKMMVSKSTSITWPPCWISWKFTNWFKSGGQHR